MDWQNLLSTPAAGEHIAQLYTDRRFLARAVGRWVRDGLARDDGVVVIATPAHWRAITRELDAADVRLAGFERRGQLVVHDAAETLATFMVGGVPDAERFRATIGRVLDDVHAAGFASIRAFGEMVDVLRRTDLAATFRLEALWNDLLAERGIALLCGYSIDAFDPHAYRGLIQQVTGVHSHLVPVEDYARFERCVVRAYDEVFGRGGDAPNLRRAFLEHYVRPAAMPDSTASILALREFAPDTADAVLASARRFYAERAS